MIANNPKIQGSILVTKFINTVATSTLRKYLKQYVDDIYALQKYVQEDNTWTGIIGVGDLSSLVCLLYFDFSQFCEKGWAVNYSLRLSSTVMKHHNDISPNELSNLKVKFSGKRLQFISQVKHLLNDSISDKIIKSLRTICIRNIPITVPPKIIMDRFKQFEGLKEWKFHFSNNDTSFKAFFLFESSWCAQKTLNINSLKNEIGGKEGTGELVTIEQKEVSTNIWDIIFRFFGQEQDCQGNFSPLNCLNDLESHKVAKISQIFSNYNPRLLFLNTFPRKLDANKVSGLNNAPDPSFKQLPTSTSNYDDKYRFNITN